MSSKMLIDATHREETRVVVKRGNRVEEFDFETLAKKQLRGNIYLAKVTRVEPSLQAAFVDYGGNRHGFLAFSEIHPDYYQIPQADRDALLADERGHDGESDDDANDTPSEAENGGNVDGDGLSVKAAVSAGLFASEEVAADDDESDNVDESGSDDALEEARPRRRPSRRHYKIQEVIKRRQIILVQVVKEERGNKGAALTTYLSLAGRYAVLMPNTPRGGGISRKITSAADRKRLKEVVSDLDVPDGMGVILRTAGANRTKVEIKRDFEYMMRLWETVRDVTLKSAAPALVYEEGSLIKRSIRDLYSRDIDEVMVAGDEGYREAKDFMRMLMPSHARNVKPYRDPTPLFTAQGVEEQLDSMFEPTVKLKSGGYLVINQTEALVAIDVNSGKSTKEHNIEDTAVSTNLEAADEIARQLRLRDLAGLIVCDFIDMEEKRNNRAVEKRMKDALKSDRARIQVGRISHFGLLEMSRQRIRTSLIESTMEPCPHCAGTGHTRASSSVALQILRQAEAQLLRHQGHHANVALRSETALYILNHKRAMLADLEARYGRRVVFTVDGSMAADAFTITRGEAADPRDVVPLAAVVQPTSVDLEAEERADQAAAEAAEAEERALEADNDDKRSEKDVRSSSDDEESGDGRKRRRRRRRRRGGGDDEAERGSDENGEEETAEAKSTDDETSEDEGEPKKRRRSRRGGRRRRGGRGNGDSNGDATTDGEADADGNVAEPAAEKVADTEITAVADPVEETADEPVAEQSAAEEVVVVEQPAVATVEPEPEPVPEPAKDPVVESSNPDSGPKKQGWWQKRSFF
ncbi:MAG: Rne/Rng family ribonuclease [Rhizobiales bacterium]|nr:Rne/Rng family ribonuclease [Hyphomicrobiales bacterium]MBO6698247.1 Rne/Rng family ribonuclease [Hyphomicrobiales bacterium]MBO6735499.1 Rne/Rng family ribonuclease [Hyphomicrobiales bacterium]MBO6910693.1 Rne/Rng family ribonuclease [Hyphomicrobiales bacterium]MBO6957227.1 Rne/Rng family ribonuclease [Hyphomicrobiales bacterium]